MRKFFGFIVASILLVIGHTSASSQEFAKGILIVKFKSNVKVEIRKDLNGNIVTAISTIDELNKKYGVKEADRLFRDDVSREFIPRKVIIKGQAVKVPSLSNIYKLKLDENADIFSAVREYKSNPNVIYAEPDYIAYACGTPDDPYFGEQWGLTQIQAEAAWDTETGDTSVIIGILDTGVDTAHPDIKDNLWINEAEYNGTANVDDDGNGKIDDIYGWNFVNNNNDPNDGTGHGSHCAGTIGAVTDNNIGVAGVSWKSKLMAVKVLNNSGSGLYSHIAEGIIYAAQNGAKVINMSLGGYVYSSLWEDALVNAYVTSVPVGAAGNDNKEELFYPACFPMVLGVAATDSLDVKWDFSNYGDWVDLSAPGLGIFNTHINSLYGWFTGTSQAAPFVSGVAALVASYKPDFSSGAIMNMIVNNTDPIDSLNPGYEGLLGSGRLNAELALTGNTLPKFIVLGDTIKDPTGDNDGVPDVSETVNLILVLQNNGMDATGVSATLHTDDIDITVLDSTANFGNVLARENGVNSADTLTFSVSDTCPQHNVLFKLYLSANAGAYKDTAEFYITTSNERNVSGIIDTNTIWKRGTYIVDGNVLVDSGITLTIEPGTEIRLDSAKAIGIKGTLNAIGTETDSIIFTRNSPDTTKRWGNLWLKPSSKGNFKYCRIEWAVQSGIYCEGDSLYVGYSTISNNVSSQMGGGGIWTYVGYFSGGLATITHNTISHNSSYYYIPGGGGYSSNGGGIWSGGSSMISYNTISSNYGGNDGGGIWTDDKTTINYNTISCNNSGGKGGGIFACGSAIISYNTISYNFANGYGYGGGGIHAAGSVTISYNTIIDTSSSTILVSCTPELHQNNIFTTHYAVYNNIANNISADSNWWGTTNTAKIDSLIYDCNDDLALGVVDYTPFLTSPCRDAPPYLDSLRVYPEPVGIETLYLYLTFSKSMDIGIAPKVTFGIDDTCIDTVNALQIDGVWADSMHWTGYYLINEMVLDTVYRIRVSDAYDDSFPFPIPTDTRGTFRVYTAGSASRELIAESGTDRITLHWHLSSIPNLLGYNIYRDTTSGGPYDQINPQVITDTSYADTTAIPGINYYYVYTILDNNFKESSYSSEASGYIGVEEAENKPHRYLLFGSCPNPFVNYTLVKYAIPEKTYVSLKVYDITGRLVKTLVDNVKEPGYYAIFWDSRDTNARKLPSGIYFYRLKTSNYRSTKKIILLH
ncbi:S8 family serine peptidase [candidate division WOR-3 bacterium]|nr:S8 family serine peptidase [candidate division WOR-3 bacterium]